MLTKMRRRLSIYPRILIIYKKPRRLKTAKESAAPPPLQETRALLPPQKTKDELAAPPPPLQCKKVHKDVDPPGGHTSSRLAVLMTAEVPSGLCNIGIKQAEVMPELMEETTINVHHYLQHHDLLIYSLFKLKTKFGIEKAM